ncbi:sugar-transfer associated ATP-grasp domain-containing protein [uncultured Sphingomonas sp.]|uniref:sugar-transfer associated ATP-grasp domain-containing protein n=1 Tax=uncultured Sphingomonas sp. TaxID=158754 RepID=UPI0035CA473A
MLTLRALPPADADATNALLQLYRGTLRARWGRPERRLAALLARCGLGVGWSKAELSFLAPAVREAGLSMAERKGLHRILNPAAFPLRANPLKNKLLFARHAAQHDLPIPATFDADAGSIDDWLTDLDAVILKRNYSSKGQGIEAFARGPDGWRPGDVTTTLGQAARRGSVIQERLVPHPMLADLSPGALPTLRVMTCRNEAGGPEECGIVLRLSAGGPRPVDNFNAGNLAVAVDGSGRCGRALHRRGDAAVVVQVHPTTGRAFTGRPVPGLAEATALALRAHRTLGDGWTVVGWDVGLAPGGPVLIEGNWNPGTVIPQLVGEAGVDRTRLGELYRHHLHRAPPERWAAARVMHWDRRPG